MPATLSLVPRHSRSRARAKSRRPAAHQPLAAIADRYAASLLDAAAQGRPPASGPRDTFEALQLLAEHSIFFNQQQFHETEGDPICAAFDAGVAWGLALGSRGAAAIAGPLPTRRVQKGGPS
jgi:hypothetical protein